MAKPPKNTAPKDPFELKLKELQGEFFGKDNDNLKPIQNALEQNRIPEVIALLNAKPSRKKYLKEEHYKKILNFISRIKDKALLATNVNTLIQISDFFEYANDNNETLLHLAALTYNKDLMVEALKKAPKEKREHKSLDGKSFFDYIISGRISNIFEPVALVRPGYTALNALMPQETSEEPLSKYEIVCAVIGVIAKKDPESDEVRLIESIMRKTTDEATKSLRLLVQDKKSNQDVIKAICKLAKLINNRDIHLTDALFFTIALPSFNQENFSYLVSNKFDVNSLASTGETLLHYTSNEVGPSAALAVETILKAGAKPNATDKNGSNALMRAARNGNIEIADLLLRYGANINAHGGAKGGNALHRAVEEEQIGMVQFLLDNGVNFRDNSYKSPNLPEIALSAAQLGRTILCNKNLNKENNQTINKILDLIEAKEMPEPVPQHTSSGSSQTLVSTTSTRPFFRK